MTWLAFIASIIGSLAWPSVVIVLLVLLRRQLPGLAQRLQEVSLPGGAKATFATKLEEARAESEKIVATRPPFSMKLVGSVQNKRDFFDLAKEFPEAAVLEAYKELEEVLLSSLDKLPPERKQRPISQIVELLYQRELIQDSARDLFERLRNLRNIAAHGRSGVKITPAEAVEYQALSVTLAQILRDAISKLPDRNP